MGRTRTWRWVMCDIPLDLQRKFEQRWAARFARPAPPVAPKEELEGQDQPPATRGKAKRKPRRVEAVLEIFIAGLKSRASAKTYPAPHPGAGLSGAPLTETGPTGLGSRDVFLRDVRPGREHSAVEWRRSSVASPRFVESPLAPIARRADWIFFLGPSADLRSPA